jgi:hypothetical protein
MRIKLLCFFMDINGIQVRVKLLSACSWTQVKTDQIKLLCPSSSRTSIKDEDQAPLPPLHGHQGRRISIKLLCLLFMAIKEDGSTSSSSASSSWPSRKTDQHQAPLPLHEISKDRSASSSTASSWTPMKIRMNLKP